MTIATDTTINFEGKNFYGAKEIGFTDRGTFIVSLYTTPLPKPQGGYFTCLPISDLAYRNKHPTKSYVKDHGNAISIADDWGTESKIKANRPILDQLLQECLLNNIPLVDLP